MDKYQFRGFDQLEEDSVLLLSLPLCEILHSLMGHRNYSYIAEANYPIELVETILHFLKYEKGVDEALLDEFAAKYVTVDSLYPMDKLLELWGREKYDRMVAELKELNK